MMLISSWSLPHNDKGLGRKLAVDGLAHPNVAKSNTTPLISNHKLHPKVIVASSANVFMLHQLGWLDVDSAFLNYHGRYDFSITLCKEH